MFLLWPFPLFFSKGTNLSATQSISIFKILQHFVAVLFFSVLFQSIFAKYFLMCLYLPLWTFVLYLIFLFRSPFTLMIKYIWVWSLHPSGSNILTLSTHSFCELKTMSTTFSLLVACNSWCSLPVLCRDVHCICPWLKSPIIIQSRLLTSLIALCAFSLSSMLMFGLRYTNPTVNVEFPVTTMLHQTACHIVLLFLILFQKPVWILYYIK